MSVEVRWCHQPVEGAPVQPGSTVFIVCEHEDESRDERFAGRRGVVRALFYDDAQRQYPAQPMMLVRVDGLGEDLFFPHELLAP